MRTPLLDRGPQRRALAKQVLLADELVERARPHAIYERFVPSDSMSGADEWGNEAHVHGLLDGAFELEIEELVWHLMADSPEAAWTLMSEGAPPVKALLGNLDPAEIEEFRAAMLERGEGFQTEGGGVDEPRRYLLVTGRRR